MQFLVVWLHFTVSHFRWLKNEADVEIGTTALVNIELKQLVLHTHCGSFLHVRHDRLSVCEDSRLPFRHGMDHKLEGVVDLSPFFLCRVKAQ